MISYFLILLFVGLAILILLRPSKRSDTAFSLDEITKRKEEEMKKLKKH